MSFTPPADDLIRQAFPQIASLSPLDQGGFKVVYRIGIGGKTEAFKLIQIPLPTGTQDPDAFRHEITRSASSSCWIWVSPIASKKPP